jgi:hypothetical protein
MVITSCTIKKRLVMVAYTKEKAGKTKGFLVYRVSQ